MMGWRDSQSSCTFNIFWPATAARLKPTTPLRAKLRILKRIVMPRYRNEPTQTAKATPTVRKSKLATPLSAPELYTAISYHKYTAHSRCQSLWGESRFRRREE